MIELNFQQGDEMWKRLRKRALSDLYFFSATVLGYSDIFPMHEETHLLPLLFAGRQTGIPEVDNAPYQLILWPRRTGKSSLVTIARSLQLATANPNTSIMIANEKMELAAEFLDSIKKHVQTNDLYRALFPEVIPPDTNKIKWSQTQAELHRDTARPQPTFFAIGSGAALAGKHPDHIVCDDLISDEAMENARAGNHTIMGKTNRWINHLGPVLSSVAKPFPTLTFIGTRWWYNDSYDHVREFFGGNHEEVRYRISAKLGNGKKVSRIVSVRGNLAIMEIAAIENGNVVFPEIWPREEVEHMLQQDPEFASCNLLNNPSNAAVRTLQDDWLRYWRYVDNECRQIMYKSDDGSPRYLATEELHKVVAVDPAACDTKNNNQHARNAIVVLGTDMSDGRHFVLDVHADRSDPEELVTDVVNICQKWGVHQVYIELAGQQLYVQQWVAKVARERGYPLSVEDLKPSGRNKDLRIGGLVIPFKNGGLFVHISQTQLIEDEYRHYRPGARNRDVLDALAYAVEVAPKPLGSGRGTSAKKRSQQQLDSYRRRLRGSIHAAH